MSLPGENPAYDAGRARVAKLMSGMERAVRNPESSVATREQYMEEFKRKILAEDGIEVTDDQAEEAWQRFTDTDGVLLDDGSMIGRERFFKERREYYANRKNRPIKLTDEQLEKLYQRARAASRENPLNASEWADAENPFGSAPAPTAECATTEAVQDTAKGISESDTAPMSQAESKSEVSENDQPVSEQESNQTNPQISSELGWTVMFLKPYLNKMGFNRIAFDSRVTGESEVFVQGDEIYLNEIMVTTTEGVRRAIARGLITSRARKESGDENKYTVEDVVCLADQMNKEGLLSMIKDGAVIRYQLGHLDETVEELRRRCADFCRENGFSEAEIAENTTEAEMREEIAVNWLSMMMNYQCTLERLAGIKPNLLTRLFRRITR